MRVLFSLGDVDWQVMGQMDGCIVIALLPCSAREG